MAFSGLSSLPYESVYPFVLAKLLNSLCSSFNVGGEISKNMPRTASKPVTVASDISISKDIEDSLIFVSIPVMVSLENAPKNEKTNMHISSAETVNERAIR